MSDTSVKNEFDGLRADFTKMRDDLASLTKAIGEMTAHEATDRLSDLKQTGKTVERQFHKVVDGADTLCQSGIAAVERQIDERPLVILALAFGVGLLIGKVAQRR